MAFNPRYEEIGKEFVKQYYAMFDDPALRPNLANFYLDNKSLMTIEGCQIMGRTKITEKLKELTFQSITHIITTVDLQPTFDNGILALVLGQLKTDDDPPHTFNQLFVLKQEAGNYYVEHDIFRISLHI